jgi:hypothetical protein
MRRLRGIGCFRGLDRILGENVTAMLYQPKPGLDLTDGVEEFLRIERGLVSIGVFECNGEWLLKNSLARNPQKFRRARKPYKRRSRFCWTFSIPLRRPFSQKRGFFNSHSR